MSARPGRGRRAYVTFVVVVLAAGAVWLGRDLVAVGTQSRIEPLRTVQVTRGSLEITAAATGSFQPLEYVDVGAQLSGQLKSVRVALGDQVRRGDLLAEIDDTTARTRLAQNEAALASIRAQLAAKTAQVALARSQRDRNVRLVEQGFLSVAMQDTAEASLASLLAEAASLEAQADSLAAAIEQARTELAFARVHAPIGGVVVAIVARTGQTLNASQQAPVILRIANMASLVLLAQVSEADVVRIAEGTQARLSLLGESEREYAGRVRQILPSPTLINNVVFYDVLVEVPHEPVFRIGMTAQTLFQLEHHACMLKVPRIALPADFRAPNKATLRLLEATRTVREVAVDITAINDTEAGVPCEAAGTHLTAGADVVLPAPAAGKKSKGKSK